MIQSLFLLTQFLIHSSLALTTVFPNCLDASGNTIGINNTQVEQWKTTTQNQFLSRAHVEGVVMDIYPDHSGHNHFSIALDNNPNEGLEVVYNSSFGALPAIKIGMKVEACGDYITSNAPTDQYPASPVGAIIHYIHKNSNPKGHKSGYLAIDGQLYGQGSGHFD